YYALTGADFTLSRRLTASTRFGATFRDQDDSTGTSAIPYAEGSLNYALTKTSQVSANVRYGYNDNGSTGQESTKSTRAGVAYSQSLTPHLRGTLSLNGNFVESGVFTPREDTISASAGLQYDVSKYLSVFATYNQIRELSSADTLEYTKNIYYLGATYTY
ncbi:MAG: outer membrane beta-barrel protein, partial [Chthoniobacteraceae bacterium]|nr:outer membrane beta-barrel protein [Chthoniobacteraceae bacterium]